MILISGEDKNGFKETVIIDNCRCMVATDNGTLFVYEHSNTFLTIPYDEVLLRIDAQIKDNNK